MVSKKNGNYFITVIHIARTFVLFVSLLLSINYDNSIDIASGYSDHSLQDCDILIEIA